MQSKLFQTASAILPFHCLKPIQNVFGHSSASSKGGHAADGDFEPHQIEIGYHNGYLTYFYSFLGVLGFYIVFENTILVWYNKMIKKIMWPAPKHFPLRCCFCSGGIAGISWSHPNAIPFWAAWFRSNRMLRFLQVWTSLATSVWGLRDKHCWMTCIFPPLHKHSKVWLKRT